MVGVVLKRYWAKGRGAVPEKTAPAAAVGCRKCAPVKLPMGPVAFVVLCDAD